MSFKVTENTLLKLLQQCYISPVCNKSQNYRNIHISHPARSFRTSTTKRAVTAQRTERDEAAKFLVATDGDSRHVSFRSSETSSAVPKPGGTVSNTSKEAEQQIAIIGGGITGLSTAYYISKELPDANITLYEQSSRLGGWLSTKHVNVGNGTVTFEQGPRTIRPSPMPQALVTLELISKLHLDPCLEPKTSHASQNRFIYFPDHLVRMPGPGEDIYTQLWGMFTEPVFKGFFPAIGGEIFRPQRSLDLEDESVGSFLNRRFGTTALSENIVSALLHGIYAGDINQLSVKSIFPALWEAERGFKNLSSWLIEGLSNKARIMQLRDVTLTQQLVDIPEVRKMIRVTRSASLYSFDNGITALSDALTKDLKSNPKVNIRMEEGLESLKYESSSEKVFITTSKSQPPVEFDNAIATISGRDLSNLTSNKGTSSIPSLDQIHSVTVMVVNLCFANPDLLPVNGFGYLIPRSIPLEQNPECALGVIFDSALSMEEQSPYTKITVMLGGHWWDGFSQYPDEEEGVAMAKSLLKRHLKIFEEPAAVLVALQKQCIPQYTVGHEERLKRAHLELQQKFGGKLAVAGSSYTGVGINDCIRAARDVATDLKKFHASRGLTGLEQFQGPRGWAKGSINMSSKNA